MTRLLTAWLAACACTYAQPLDGVWRSHGYGYVYQIRGDRLKAFEVTTRTCVAGFTAKRRGDGTFRIRGGDILTIAAGSDADHKVLAGSESLSHLRIERIPKLPAVCTPPAPDTPLANFDVFSQTFTENYIGFDLRKIDWEKTVSENRAKVTERTTPAELFTILEGMLRPWGDIHTGIGARRIHRETPDFWRRGTDRVVKGNVDAFAKKGRAQLFAVTDTAWLRGPLRQYCNGKIRYGSIEGGIGYLRILGFSGYAKYGGYRSEIAELGRALDEIFADSGLRGFVIDVRLAFGGDDRFGLAIASRLTDREYLAYVKQARSDAVDRDKWTATDTIMVKPSSRPSFHGPLIELIGPIALSAAETFTQSLMGRTPHVTRIGENTQGVFSDVLERRLPSGWSFGLPNEVYRTAQGEIFDVRGIPPDLAVPVYADEDVAAGRDPALGRAVRILTGAP